MHHMDFAGTLAIVVVSIFVNFSSNEEWLDARILYWKRELNTALAEITELRAELENMRKLATL